MVNYDHVKHLMSWLRGEKVSLDSIVVKCEDGDVPVCRLSLGLYLPFLQDLDEFWSPNFEPVIMLPEENVTEFRNSLTSFLTHPDELAKGVEDTCTELSENYVLVPEPSIAAEESVESPLLIEEVKCEPAMSHGLITIGASEDVEVQNSDEIISDEESADVEYGNVILKDFADLDENQTLIENVMDCGFEEEGEASTSPFTSNLMKVENANANIEDYTIDYVDTEETKSPLKSKISASRTEETRREKKYSGCPVCGSMISRYNMEQHLSTHNKSFSCSACAQAFAKEANKVAHERNLHGLHKNGEIIAKNRLLPCDLCDKVFLAKYHLKTHRSSHTNEKLYPCDSCGKHYSSKSNLKSHMKIHEGIHKVFNCPYDKNCGKKFSHRSEVKQHRVVHTKMKEYRCVHCGNIYGRYPSLWKHMRKCTFNPQLHSNQESKQDEETLIEDYEDTNFPEVDDKMDDIEKLPKKESNTVQKSTEKNAQSENDVSEKADKEEKTQDIQSIGVEIQEPSGEISQFDTVLLFEN